VRYCEAWGEVPSEWLGASTAAVRDCHGLLQRPRNDILKA